MGNQQVKNRGAQWGEKKHASTDQAFINSLVGKEEWKMLVELLTANPEYASISDAKNMNMLPIHRAILKNASFELIEKLVEVYVNHAWAMFRWRFSVLSLSYFLLSAALHCLALLVAYSMMVLVLHNTIILIITRISIPTSKSIDTGIPMGCLRETTTT